MQFKVILSLIILIFTYQPYSALGEEFQLTLEAREIEKEKIEFVISTNIPLPVEVMVDITLADLKPNDTWIGADDRIWLREPKTVFILDATGKNLPAGEYEANISYYQRWGWKNGNPEAENVPNIEAIKVISYKGTGGSASAAKEKDKLQKWVIEEVYMGYPWNLSFFIKNLGDFERYDSTLSRLHDAYYFPKADMTLLVNRVKNEVTVWRFGKKQK